MQNSSDTMYVKTMATSLQHIFLSTWQYVESMLQHAEYSIGYRRTYITSQLMQKGLDLSKLSGFHLLIQLAPLET